MEDYAKQKAKIISDWILGLFDLPEESGVEQMIWKRAKHDAEGYFFDNEIAQNLEDYKQLLRIKLDCSERKINKMNHEEVLAYVIKIYTLDELERKDFMVL